MSPDPELPDFDLSISARAESIRFDVVPDVEVWWDGTSGSRGRSWEDRDNLPEDLEPGVAYEDAAVRWWASGRVGDQPEIKEG